MLTLVFPLSDTYFKNQRRECKKMQLAEVELFDIIERMIPSDRIIVVSDGTEIYRGYVANIRKEKTEGLIIKQIGLCTHVFRRKETARYIHMQALGEEVSPEHVNDLVFSDLEMIIYTKVIVERV